MTLIVNGTVGRGEFRRDVSFTVEAGQSIGLVGPNGAGKTTILHAIAGLDRLITGSVVLDGETLDGPNEFVAPEERRAVVVFQDLRLFPTMDVLANVAFGPRCHGAPKAEAQARARESLRSVGLEGMADRHPESLSGGEKQRVALARAFVTNPRILLLDEPFAAVDAESRPALRSVLKSLLAGSDAHTVIVSHDAADISDLCRATIDLRRHQEFT